MDNLNTHRPGALYEAFEPAEAKALWDRFEFVHTPTHGSWLNVAEVELNVLIRQCLNRRIDSIDTLRAEVAAWQDARDRIRARVDGQFTTDDARDQAQKRLYPTFDAVEPTQPGRFGAHQGLRGLPRLAASWKNVPLRSGALEEKRENQVL